jgi:hypothetical protein
MIERITVPHELALGTPPTRGARPYADDNEVSRRLKGDGVCLKEIARKAAQVAESGVILRVRAAQFLNISYRTLLYKIKGLGLDRAARSAQRHPGRLGTGQDPKAYQC